MELHNQATAHDKIVAAIVRSVLIVDDKELADAIPVLEAAISEAAGLLGMSDDPAVAAAYRARQARPIRMRAMREIAKMKRCIDGTDLGLGQVDDEFPRPTERHLAGYLQSRVMQAFRDGRIVASGFDDKAKVGSGERQAIRPDRWKYLVPDFENGSAFVVGDPNCEPVLFAIDCAPAVLAVQQAQSPAPAATPAVRPLAECVREALDEAGRLTDYILYLVEQVRCGYTGDSKWAEGLKKGYLSSILKKAKPGLWIMLDKSELQRKRLRHNALVRMGRARDWLEAFDPELRRALLGKFEAMAALTEN